MAKRETENPGEMEEIEWVQPFLFDLRCVTGYNESCKFGALFEQAQMGEVGGCHSSPSMSQQ